MRRMLILIPLYLLLSVSVSFGAADDSFYESQMDRGIRNSDVYSYLLIQEAGKNNVDTVEILKKTLTYSPDLPAVYFEMSKAVFSFSITGVLDSFNYLVQGINAYFRNFWWSFTLIQSLFLSLILSFILAISFTILIRLFRDLPLISHDIKETGSKVFFLPVLLLLSLMSPLLFMAGILVLLGVYMKTTDRIVVILFLVFLIFSPLIFNTVSRFVMASSSGDIRALVQVNEAKGNNYAITVLNKNDDDFARFSYALALKREGYYDDAITIYKRLIEKWPDPKVFINLGNCYVGLNNMDEAVKNYLVAINIKPLPSAYYNLSQVSRELFDFEDGDRYFMAAVALDRTAVAKYRETYGRSPNRIVVDESLNFSDLWDYVMGTSKETSSYGISTIPLSLIPVMSLALLACLIILDRKLKSKAYMCRKCSAILCTKCEKHLAWGEMCPQCYRSLVKLEEPDVKQRVSRLLSVQLHQKKRRNTMKILTFILPGSAHTYAGQVLHGFILSWVFLFFISVPAINSMFKIDGFSANSMVNCAAVCVAAVVYGVYNLLTRQRISRGWL